MQDQIAWQLLMVAESNGHFIGHMTTAWGRAGQSPNAAAMCCLCLNAVAMCPPADSQEPRTIIVGTLATGLSV